MRVPLLPHKTAKKKKKKVIKLIVGETTELEDKVALLVQTYGMEEVPSA
jgi:hypothetical protein